MSDVLAAMMATYGALDAIAAMQPMPLDAIEVQLEIVERASAEWVCLQVMLRYALPAQAQLGS